jgi:hypothetical protein
MDDLLMATPEEMYTNALFSACGNYRYTLTRQWDRRKPSVLFIGLNPSTADETKDDPTIRRCIGFARCWGFGGIMMGNLFAYRATDPKDMLRQIEPVGQNNDRNLLDMADRADMTVAAWGNHGAHMKRADAVRNLLAGREVFYLGLTGAGQPKHPLYLRHDTAPCLWETTS